MAAVPAGQPGVPVTGDGPGQGTPSPRQRRLNLAALALAAVAALVAIRMAQYAGVVGIDAVDEVARGLAACVLVFGVAGFGVVRFCLPAGLRRHELLWILPTGAVTVAFAMTPLGFLGMPFGANLAIVGGAGLALSVLAWRRRGLPARPQADAIGWPAYLGLLLFAVALIPLFRSGFATVIGDGSDAHMAAGTAEFLRHNPPLGVDPPLPVDQVWLVWRSKQAIYYAFGAVATVAGMETYEVLSTLAAFLLTLASIGMYLLARELLGATVGAAAVALWIVGLDRMVLHTGMHPYFNQTWGYLTMPFSILLVWWLLRHPSWGGAILLGLFLIVGAFAYPLAVPIPALVLVVAWWVDRRERLARGERVLEWRDVRARVRAAPRRVRWPAYALALILIVPIWGAYEKFEGAVQLMLSPRQSLQLWGGDLESWFPEQRFFSIHLESGWWIALLVILGLALWELRRLAPSLRAGLLAVLLAGAVIAIEMRLRDYGWYFHFKMLAFVGPLVVVLAAVALMKLRAGRSGLPYWAATIGAVVWMAWASGEARDEVSTTFDELPLTVLELREWSDRLPAGASLRLDMQPGSQLWAAYMLADHPLCSQRPISDTSYPHVPLSRAADYAVVRLLRRPYDAVGAPVLRNKEFEVYRLRPGLPGGDRCSQRMIQTVSKIQRG